MPKRPRKTVRVTRLLDFANTQLARTDDYADQKFKAGVCSMIETALMTANVYKGFGYQDGYKPGMTGNYEERETEYNRIYYGQTEEEKKA